MDSETRSAPRGFGGQPDPEQPEKKDPTKTTDLAMLVARSRKVIFGQAKEQMLTAMGSAQSPGQGMGKAAAMLMTTMMKAAKDGGRNIPPETVIEAGADVVMDLNDLAKKNSLFEYNSPDAEKAEVTEAVIWVAKSIGDSMLQSGEITPEMQEKARREVEANMPSQPEDETGTMQRKPLSESISREVNGGIISSAMGGQQ